MHSMKESLRLRGAWCMVWVPLSLVVYSLINGGGFMRGLCELHCGSIPDPSYAGFSVQEEPLAFLQAELIHAVIRLEKLGYIWIPVLAVLAIFGYASWKLAPGWSAGMRWGCRTLSVLLVLMLVAIQLSHMILWGFATTQAQFQRGYMTVLQECWTPHMRPSDTDGIPQSLRPD